MAVTVAADPDVVEETVLAEIDADRCRKSSKLIPVCLVRQPAHAMLLEDSEGAMHRGFPTGPARFSVGSWVGLGVVALHEQ